VCVRGYDVDRLRDDTENHQGDDDDNDDVIMTMTLTLKPS